MREMLSKEETDILESLVNPDENRESQYRWDLRYQQEILSMLLMDKVFLIQSRQLVKPKYFVDRVHQTICGFLFDYFDKYQQLPPKFVIATHLKEKFKDSDKKLIVHMGELNVLLEEYICGLESRDHCLGKIRNFAKEQALKCAVSETLSIIETKSEDKWSKIEEVFRSALSVDFNFDGGLDYFQSLEDRYDRMEKQSLNKEVFITGFESIDSGLSSGGVCRGEIAAFMSTAGTGKSVLLVKTAAQNVLRGKKALFISLEMDQDKIAKRFDAMLTCEDIRSLLEKKNEVINALKDHIKDEEDKRRLIIKQFAAGTADMTTIRAYLTQLSLHGWKPDLLCVDYVGEFKDHEGIKTYESRQRIVRDLRGLATEENIAVFTALQSNRRGRESQDTGVIDDDVLGDSFGQVRPLDCLYSINQNQQEKALGVGRIFVVKHRDGKSRYQLYYKQNKETLDMQEISQEIYGIKMSEFVKKKTDSTEDAINKIIGKKQFKPNGGNDE